MKKKGVRYQTIEVKYPRQLYLVGVFVYRKDRLLPIILFEAYPSVDLACKDAKIVIKQLNKENKVVKDAALIIPISYQSDVPLVKKYWDNPTINIGAIDRMVMFCDAVNEPNLHDLLITPRITKIKGKNNFIYRTASVFHKNPTPVEIAGFLISSKFEVTPEAKNAALYTFDEAYGYRISKKEIIAPEKLAN